MLLNLFLLGVGLVLLTRGADFFVDGAGAMARRFHIPEIVIGLTIVAMGTSAPEAAVSIASAIRGTGGVAIGNIIGSNIANILLILGVTATICTLPVARNTIRFEIPFVIFISIVLGIFGLYFGAVTCVAATILLMLFMCFMWYLFKISANNAPDDVPADNMGVAKMALFIIGGIAALVLGSNITVAAATDIARALNVSDRIIGLTIVAFGTSLPELVTCIVAAIKRQSDLAIGNIIGSNIFNILFVLGLAGVIRPIPFDAAFMGDMIMALAATILLLLAVMRGGKLTRMCGIMFLAIYVVYIISLII